MIPSLPSLVLWIYVVGEVQAPSGEATGWPQQTMKIAEEKRSNP